MGLEAAVANPGPPADDCFGPSSAFCQGERMVEGGHATGTTFLSIQFIAGDVTADPLPITTDGLPKKGWQKVVNLISMQILFSAGDVAE